MLNTLTNALVYHEFFRHSDMVALAVATGGMMTLANDSHGDAVGYRLDGLLIKLFHDRLAGRLPVAVTGNSPQHTIKGTVAVDLSAHPSGSPTYPLDVFAALSADKKTIALSVANSTEITQECNLAFYGRAACRWCQTLAVGLRQEGLQLRRDLGWELLPALRR